MKPRTVLILVAVAITALALAFTLSGTRRPVAGTPASAKLLPGLYESLDSVTRVRIVGAGDTTLATLERKEMLRELLQGAPPGPTAWNLAADPMFLPLHPDDRLRPRLVAVAARAA